MKGTKICYAGLFVGIGMVFKAGLVLSSFDFGPRETKLLLACGSISKYFSSLPETIFPKLYNLFKFEIPFERSCT